VKVIPVTAAPAGWCDQMARMWPVDGVISENGGLFIQRDGEYGVKRKFWHNDAKRQAISDQLAAIGRHIAQDRRCLQMIRFFRLTSLAFVPPDGDTNAARQTTFDRGFDEVPVRGTRARWSY